MRIENGKDGIAIHEDGGEFSLIGYMASKQQIFTNIGPLSDI